MGAARGCTEDWARNEPYQSLSQNLELKSLQTLKWLTRMSAKKIIKNTLDGAQKEPRWLSTLLQNKCSIMSSVETFYQLKRPLSGIMQSWKGRKGSGLQT